MTNASGEVSPWISRELLSQKPGVYLFKAQEAVGMALPFDASTIREGDRYAVAVYSSDGKVVREQRVLDRTGVLRLVQQHSSEHVLLSHLEPQLADIFERRGY